MRFARNMRAGLDFHPPAGSLMRRFYIPRMVQIEILSGPDTGKVLDLGPGTHTIGRAKTNDLVLALDSVSGQHLEIQIEASGLLRFKDLGSTNGTWTGGVQVKDGEWFPGSELRVGDCSLRHLDSSAVATTSPGASATDDAGDDVHRRAREAAMSDKKKGGPLTMVLGVVLISGAAGAAWWTFGGGGSGGEEGKGTAGKAGSGGTAVVSFDAIDNYGSFEEPEVWTLPKGVSLESGLVQNESGRNEIRLSKSFPMDDGALEISATVAGMSVRPVLSWGEDDAQEVVLGSWEAQDLSKGSSTLPLPANAKWFQISLILNGNGSLSNLSVQSAAGAPTKASTPFGSALSSGANLFLTGPLGDLLIVRGQGGIWSASDHGMTFTPSGESTLAVSASEALSQSGSFLILGDGGPVGNARGVRVDQSPGLLIGDSSQRFMLRFESPATVLGGQEAASFLVLTPVTLLWDLREVITDAARLTQEINRAARSGEVRNLLASTARLLRELPLDEVKVQEALLLSRNAIEAGRQDFSNLQLRASGALFVGAIAQLDGLNQQVLELAARFPGTNIAGEAKELSAVLESALGDLRSENEAQAKQYRTRVQSALATTYPVLSAWIKKEAN
ncbi:MAG: FHA domain-containing protein [Planctomycetota bacterium]|nr:FHA domain-containing protein [Planctomycetota bacterium]